MKPDDQYGAMQVFMAQRKEVTEQEVEAVLTAVGKLLDDAKSHGIIDELTEVLGGLLKVKNYIIDGHK